ncbi:MAG: OmpA family protein [Candidatus Solibacter sp.]
MGTRFLLVWAAAGCICWAQSDGKVFRAIGYPVGGGSTKVDLKPSGPIPGAIGQAKVEAKPGVSTVEAEVAGLKPPTDLGAELLTYVLWAVSVEGRAVNLGGIPLEADGKGKLKATTQLQAFSLFVTAEPYATVRQPSEVLILENDIRKGTKGTVFNVREYKLMRRTEYAKKSNPLALTMDLKNTPLEVYEARNAVEIAKARGADTYAAEIFQKSEGALTMAEAALKRKASKKDIVSPARLAAQFAEDARALTIEKQEQERIEAERTAAAAKAKNEAEAIAATQAAEAQRKSNEAAERQRALAAEAQRKANEEAERQRELAAAKQAQLRAEASAREAQIKAQAEIAEAQAKSREDAAKADAERERLAASQLRAQLLEQFNRILETRDSPRGLVVTMADVLFDTGKFDLREQAREKLARFSGILLAHPGLTLEVEGHTDATGSDELNQKLSLQRSGAVRDYLIRQGLPETGITATGFGKEMPVADNSTAAGRQQNRRVELIVSGEVIGIKIGQ